MFFSLFVLFILIRFAGKHLDENAKPVELSDNILVNYYPVVFHSLIVFLLLLSCFSNNVLNHEKIHALVTDGIFQFTVTLIILIVSVINPFSPMSLEIKQKIDQQMLSGQNYWLNWFLAGKNWQLVKLLACIVIIGVMINQRYLSFPSLRQGLISDVFIILIVFYVFGCIVQLIKDPELFKKQTKFRLSMLYKSFKKSFFISLVLCLTIFILANAMNLTVKDVINYEGIVLFVYNVVMAYNEFKILNS